MGFIPLWSPFIRRHFLMGRLVQGCPPVLFLLLCLAAEAAAVQLCFFWGCEQKNGDFWGDFTDFTVRKMVISWALTTKNL